MPASIRGGNDTTQEVCGMSDHYDALEIRDPAVRESISEVLYTLGEAITELESDPVVIEALGEHVFNHYVEAKRAEWDEYRTQVSDWEVERYLEQF